MTTITKEEYEYIINAYSMLEQLIIEKTNVLSQILYNKPPKGTYNGYDITDKYIDVEYSRSQCGDTEYTIYQLPFEFLFDETYPEKYKERYQREFEIKELEKQRQVQELIRLRNLATQGNEYKEYLRLRNKFKDKVILV